MSSFICLVGKKTLKDVVGIHDAFQFILSTSSSSIISNKVW